MYFAELERANCQTRRQRASRRPPTLEFIACISWCSNYWIHPISSYPLSIGWVLCSSDRIMQRMNELCIPHLTSSTDYISIVFYRLNAEVHLALKFAVFLAPISAQLIALCVVFYEWTVNLHVTDQSDSLVETPKKYEKGKLRWEFPCELHELARRPFSKSVLDRP